MRGGTPLRLESFQDGRGERSPRHGTCALTVAVARQHRADGCPEGSAAEHHDLHNGALVLDRVETRSGADEDVLAAPDGCGDLPVGYIKAHTCSEGRGEGGEVPELVGSSTTGSALASGEAGFKHPGGLLGS